MFINQRINLEGIVTGFRINGPYIICLCKNKLIQLDRFTGEILFEHTMFEKDGLSRDLITIRDHIILRDFCTLHILHQTKNSILHSFELGSDLSSDLCGMTADSNQVFASIRNGTLARIDLTTNQCTIEKISEDSMWSLLPYKEQLICGSVGGNLLFVDLITMKLVKTIPISKKNVRSLFLDGDILYISSRNIMGIECISLSELSEFSSMIYMN